MPNIQTTENPCVASENRNRGMGKSVSQVLMGFAKCCIGRWFDRKLAAPATQPTRPNSSTLYG